LTLSGSGWLDLLARVDELDETAVQSDIVVMTSATPARTPRKSRIHAPRTSGPIGGRPGRIEVPRGLSAEEARRVLTAVASSAGAAARSGRALTLRIEPATQEGAKRIHIEKEVPSSKAYAGSTQTEVGSSNSELTPTAARAALKHAYARGAVAAAEILAGSDMLSSDAIAERLGMSREAVNQKRRRGELLGLEGAKRGVRFPAWQLRKDGLPLPALRDLQTALGAPWAVFRFLRQRHPELGMKTGLQAISHPRQAAEALRLARSIGDFGPSGA
jgi:hypothetical protein